MSGIPHSRAFRRRRAALWLALLLALGLLASAGVMLAEIGHRCTGHDCRICEGILRLQALLRGFAALAVILLPLRRPFAPTHGAKRRDVRLHRALTPVALRIRMND
ncbi:MAG: hypothetical protein GX418_00005 [Clostridiales bacterium]|nr:hypothetical protein [Clostridiales bacterium]